MAKQQNPDDIPEEKRWPAARVLPAAHKDTVTQLSFSPTGAHLASAGMDGLVVLWNVSDFTDENSFSSSSIAPAAVLEDFVGSEVECLLWHPTGAVVCAGGTNAQTVMWNAKSGAALQYFSAHRDSVTCLAWTTDVKKLVSASADGSVALLNPKTGVAEVTVTRGISRYDDASAGAPSPPIVSMEVMPSPDPLMLVGLADGCIALLSLKDVENSGGSGGSKGRVLKRAPELHDQAVEALAMSPVEIVAGQRLAASCSCDCKVVLWSVPELVPRSVLFAGEGVMRVRWLNTLVFAACTDGDVRVWEARSTALVGAAGGGAALAAAAAAGAAGAVTPPLVQLMGHRRLVLDMEIAKTDKGAVLVTVADDGSSRAFSLVTQ
jgi:WD40 repeat protein